MSTEETAPIQDDHDAADATRPVAGEASEVERIASLEARLADALVEAEQLREQALRARADADNVRKRAERDVEAAHKFGLDRFVAELLPVKDSLELGLAAADTNAAIEDLRSGTELTLRMLTAAVEKFGVQELDPAGQPFDPELHQAITAQPAEGTAAGTVLQVVQKGYRLNDRLVRPAMVIVAK